MKHQIITEQNLDDIGQAIVDKILKREKDLRMARGRFRVSGNKTFAVLTWISGKDKNIHIKSGVASKRKGDVYNRRTGEILALINML